TDQLNIVVVWALFDGDSQVRRSALGLLTRGRIRRSEWTRIIFDAGTATEQPADVQGTFWGYLEEVVAAEDRQQLESMLADGAPAEHVEKLLRIARSQSEPGQVLAQLATTPDPPSERVLAELMSRIQTIDSVVLVAAFSSRHDSVRQLIASELDRRGALND